MQSLVLLSVRLPTLQIVRSVSCCTKPKSDGQFASRALNSHHRSVCDRIPGQHHAAWAGESDTVQDLLERGADPNEPDDFGWTTLHMVALSGSIESARVLVRSGASLAIRSGDGHTLLEMAQARGHREVAYALRVAIVSSQEEEYSENSTLDRMTEMFIALMESGELPPWMRPWGGWRIDEARNPYGRRYSGINVFHLREVARVHGYDDPRWVTSEWASKNERPIRKGEPGTAVVSVWRGQGEDDLEEESLRSRTHTVYNMEQCEGVEKDTGFRDIRLHQGAQEVLKRYLELESEAGLKFMHTRTQRSALYAPGDDRIVMPFKNRFPDTSHYYMTAFHEIAHSTGHPRRLDRRKRDRHFDYGHDLYGREELVAEMAASLIAVETGLNYDDTHVEDAAAYLKHWLEAIYEEPSMLRSSALQAQTACDYVLDRRNVRERMRTESERMADGSGSS